MFTSDQVKDMTHSERMRELGKTVVQRMGANEALVTSGNNLKRKEMALEAHRAAVRNADVLRYR